MTPDTLVSPSRTITVGGREFVLGGSFATLRAIQESFRRDVVYVLSSIYEFRIDQIATLLAIGTGLPEQADSIGQFLIDTIDVLDFRKDAEYPVLKTELSAWLVVAIAPKAEREKKRQEMAGLIEKQKSSPSRGAITSDSPSAPSDGNPASSGEATSGS